MLVKTLLVSLVFSSFCGQLGLVAHATESDICALNSPYGTEDENVEFCKVSIQRGAKLNGVQGDLATCKTSGNHRIQAWASPEAGKDPISQGACWPNIHEPNKRCQVMIKISPAEPFLRAESFLNSMNCRTPTKRTMCVTFVGLEGRHSGAKVLTWGYNLDASD